MSDKFFNSFKQIFTLLIAVNLIALFSGCSNRFDEDRYIGTHSYKLVDQDSNTVNFPDYYKGKILVIGFIYTHCPDICPLTTHNLQMVQEELKKDEISGVQFAALSFDPERDTPGVLKHYAAIRNINTSNFKFLTGKKADIDSILSTMNVYAIATDTVVSGRDTSYSFIHTDRISLIDRDNNLRKEYSGSRANIKDIIKDVKALGD